MQRRVLLEWLATLPFLPSLRPEARSEDARFNEVADSALSAMHAQAVERKIGGVAVVAAFKGATLTAWSSKMLVVGRYKDEPTDKDKGSNLLGVAYAKAAEMADTYRDSGSHVRPPMTGEFGWTGGAIAKGPGGYVLAAFSGGKDADDLATSQAGVSVLKQLLG